MERFSVFMFISILIGLVKSDNFILPSLNFTKTNDKTRCDTHIGALAKAGLLLRMIDASAKLPPGLLTGNILDYGNFDECIQIEHNTVNDTILGKYCTASFIIEIAESTNTTPAIELKLSKCIPSGCTMKELKPNFKKVKVIENCQTKETGTEWDGGDYAVTSVFGVIAGFMILSTIYDIFLHQTKTETCHPLLIAFSILTNGRKLFAVSEATANQITCLNGLRFISMLWVIMGHRYSVTVAMPVLNILDAFQWQHKLYSSYVQSARVAVDTFFFLSGFLISYGYFKSLKKTPLTPKSIPIYYIHRYLRVTPALAALYIVQISVIRHIGSGPLWIAGFNQQRDLCLDHWWSFFTYLQNYTHYKNMCILTTWYLSADMQMFIISPLIILPLGHFALKNKINFAYIWAAGLIISAIFIPMIIHLFIENLNEYATHVKLSGWLIGIFMGMFMYEVQTKEKPRMNQIVNLVVWIIVLSGMVAILLTALDTRNYPTDLKTNLYESFSRPAWCICLCWVVYSCTIGYGGIINWILSRPIYQVVCRLSYSMYLLHVMVIMYDLFSKRTTMYFNDYSMLYIYCGDVIFTTLLSVVWVLAFESPMIIVEKVIFGNTPKRKPKTEQPITAESKKEIA